jgi:probable HAF family extracellular repeat protein
MFLASALFGAEATYTVIGIGSLFPDAPPNLSFAYDLNGSGQVAGYSQMYGATPNDPNGPPRAWRWTGGTLEDLGTLGGGSSMAGGINDDGVVTGWATLPSDLKGSETRHAFLYDTGPMQDIGGSSGFRINSAGDVAGDIYPAIPGHGSHPAFYNGGLWQDLGLLTGGTWGRAYDINMHAEIIGMSDSASGNLHAFLCRDPAMPVLEDLGTLPGGVWSSAYGINDWTQVVGTSDVGGGEFHGCLFTGATPQDLGTLISGVGVSNAFDINNDGVIVGSNFDPTSGVEHAVIWEGGIIQDLNDLIDPTSGWVLREARAINERGWIVGNGVSPAGLDRPFLLTPEPATLALLGLGAAGLVLRRRRDA